MSEDRLPTPRERAMAAAADLLECVAEYERRGSAGEEELDAFCRVLDSVLGHTD